MQISLRKQRQSPFLLRNQISWNRFWYSPSPIFSDIFQHSNRMELDNLSVDFRARARFRRSQVRRRGRHSRVVRHYHKDRYERYHQSRSRSSSRSSNSSSWSNSRSPHRPRLTPESHGCRRLLGLLCFAVKAVPFAKHIIENRSSF